MNAPIGLLRPAAGPARVRCREIEPGDVSGIVDLLAEGFPRRSRKYWARGLRNMEQRIVPQGMPRFGFLIEAGADIVGCLLLIVSEQDDGGEQTLRGNVSSWYVRPEFRFQASMLVSVAFKLKGVTFVNISPAPHTVPILQAQGYRQYVAGQAITLPAFSRNGRGVRILRVAPDDTQFGDAVPEMDLLRRHAQLGCIALIAVDGAHREPFVFARRRIVRTIVPAAQLLWCRDVAAFPRYAGPLGRYLLGHGIVAVSHDSDGAALNLPGAYREGNARKFYRGEDRPRLGDLADTELAVFGA